MKNKVGLLVCIALFSLLIGCTTTEKKVETKVVVNEKQETAKKLLAKDACYHFYYEQLNDDDKKLYEEIYEGLYKQKRKIAVSEGKEEHIYKILDFVSYDHPELYQYNGMHMYSGNEKSELLVGYGKDERSHKEIVTQLKQIKADVANHIFAGASDYDKIKIVYDYMVERCSYVEGAKNNQNILSSLVDKETVCAGYAKGIQYLLNDLGIPCTYITGEIVAHGEEEGYHAWNMVEVDGNFYYLDATWGDMVEVAPHTCYAYFMMSQSEMMQLYKPDVETMETLLYDNEFIHHHEYLNSYDETILKNIMLRCYQEGRNIMEIKCAPEAFANIEYQLTQNGGIYNVMYASGLNYGNLSYITLPELNTIEIILN